MQHRESEGPLEISLVGDLTDNEVELTDKLLGVEPGGECTLYIDSPGGSPYCAMSLTALIMLRGLRITGIVTGECSSAALWPFAACRRRMVTPYSILLFHPMKWQSEEHVGLHEASEWARHFAQLETDMDRFLADLFGAAHGDIQQWITSHRYVSGAELAAAGLAELIDFKMLDIFRSGSKAKGGARQQRQIISLPKSRGEQPRNVERNKRAAKRK
jgi:ATP-dependent Clp protease, protease subunit